MNKFAANYVLSGTGELLKNGILIANDDGTVVEIIDTKGDLDEMAQLIFHNGILIANNLYIRENKITPEKNELSQFISLKISNYLQLSVYELIDIAKQTQVEFPELTIIQIFTTIISLLNAYFSRGKKAGVFLLIHSDLVGLHLKPQSRLKQIL